MRRWVTLRKRLPGVCLLADLAELALECLPDRFLGFHQEASQDSA